MNKLEPRYYEHFETMPDGWSIDKTWGSPEYGWQPIHNGRSVLNGGRKGLLRVKPIPVDPVRDGIKNNDHDRLASVRTACCPPPSVDEVQAIVETTNRLARERFKEWLLKELLFDLQVCRIEGWDFKQYVTELKMLIDETYQTIVLK